MLDYEVQEEDDGLPKPSPTMVNTSLEMAAGNIT